LKKSILILLSFIYLATSSGIFLSIHYCSGDLSEFRFYGDAGCDCGDDAMTKDCCEDQNTFIKIKDEHNFSKLVLDPNKCLKLLTGLFHKPIEPIQNGFIVFYAKNTDGPPITSSSELNILYRVFRI
jgi:hypothetical protein